ncbi:MAG: serine/threonine protein kinase [Candidatus Riflebacteria bacterium]|nr:serine/threonine protein kinase [Candidatus Riflebacteria bacterium]
MDSQTLNIGLLCTGILLFFLYLFFSRKSGKNNLPSAELESKKKLLLQRVQLSKSEKSELFTYFSADPRKRIDEPSVAEAIVDLFHLSKRPGREFFSLLKTFEKKFPEIFTKHELHAILMLDKSEKKTQPIVLDALKRYPGNKELLKIFFNISKSSDTGIIDTVESINRLIEYQRIIEKSGSLESNELIQIIADFFFRKKIFDNLSLEYFRKLEKIRPDNVSIMFESSLCLFKMGELAEAALNLQKILVIEPAFLPAIALKREICFRSTEAADSSSEPGSMILLLERYSDFSIIARGGIGILYKCFDHVQKKWIAVKVLDPALADEQHEIVDRFVNESRIMNMLEHPAIPKIIDLSLSHPYFMALELIEGIELRKALQNEGDNGFKNLKNAIKIACDISEGFDHLVQNKVLHCDIKPENILLENSGRIKIIDFGFAVLNKPGIISPESSAIRGTPLYIAPELIKGSLPSVFSEIYAFGITLYEIISGHSPYLSNDPGDIIASNPRNLRTFREDCPEEIVILVMDCISHNPNNRPSSFKEISNELKKHIE